MAINPNNGNVSYTENRTNSEFENVKRREKMLDTLSQTAITFLSLGEGTFEDMMTDGIRLVVEMVDLDRMSIFRNFKQPDGLHTSQVYRWERKSGGTTKPLKKFVDVTYTEYAPGWQELFDKGNSVNSPVGTMPEREQATLKAVGAVSVFVTPVFLDSEFWGFVLFEDHRNERYFDNDCAEIMRSTAFLCANAVIRAEMEQDIANTNELLISKLRQQEFISEITKSFVISSESDKLIKETLAKLGQHLEASRIVIYVMDYEKGETFLAYSWHDENAPKPNPEFTGLFDFIKTAFPEILTESVVTPVFFSCDVPNDPNFKNFVSKDILAFTSAPLYIDGRMWGILGAEQCDRKRAWTESEVVFVENMTTVISGAIIRSAYNRRLTEALRHATAASKAKGAFLSNMSHEMRTPLNTIMGMASIGLNSTDSERKDYALGKIEEASSHLLGVINDILDMSKIEANKLELVLTEFSFEKTLKKTVNAICFRCEEKNQKLSVSIDGKIPHILVGDDQRITQVIINLLSNAVKFTPEGGSISLNAFLAEERDGVCIIAVEVADTGIGITPEQKTKLFHVFEQAESGMSRKFGGTGLGLAISKRIAEIMGGEISVESEFGKGSKFRFDFKVTRGKERVTNLLDPSVNWKNVRILAVDDSEEVLLYLSEIFKRYGLVCDTALCGKEALCKISECGGYDVYFVDYKMPGIDGIELSRKIKEQSNCKKCVVIMISATDWSRINEKAKQVGIDKFLTKPLFASDILDSINACLGIEGSEPAKQRRTVKSMELKGCRILLAEDVEINREIFLVNMEKTGAEIDCAVNGLEAFNMVTENPAKYDLVFMDIQMPEMDGLEATRLIRGVGCQVPIVAMTANVFKDDIEKCLDAGMDDHLGKPLDMSKVLAKARKYWNN
ncbi:MAG: response regulator [Oscillospiraceae bacterium]|nr:response regulator [Oscillospiraceae bacterium]